jgi:hypothetical protein
LDILYPESYARQSIIAFEFKRHSAINIDICAGALDGLLVWTTKPTKPDLEELNIGEKKFFCGRKKKFGLNLQAVCDSSRKFLFVEISHPGATSDFLAFGRSQLNRKLEAAGRPFLKQGLAIFADNAYENTPYMVTPFKGVNSGPRDAYNFFQSQLRITIECAFGMLVQRRGILRKPLPTNFTAKKSQKFVYCLCQLHNYCISKNEGCALHATHSDLIDIMADGGLLLRGFNPEQNRLHALLDGGETQQDTLRHDQRKHESNKDIPAQKLLSKIAAEGYQRPRLNNK